MTTQPALTLFREASTSRVSVTLLCYPAVRQQGMLKMGLSHGPQFDRPRSEIGQAGPLHQLMHRHAAIYWAGLLRLERWPDPGCPIQFASPPGLRQPTPPRQGFPCAIAPDEAVRDKSA